MMFVSPYLTLAALIAIMLSWDGGDEGDEVLRLLSCERDMFFIALFPHSGCLDQSHDPRPNRCWQAGPAVDDVGQVGVYWGRIARKCAGFCAALGRDLLISRGIGRLFESLSGSFR